MYGNPSTVTPAASQIEGLRARIDAVNGELLRLLECRAELALAIARVKGEHAMAFRDIGRERTMLASLLSHSRGLYEPGEIEEVFDSIFAASRSFAARTLAGIPSATERR